MQEMQQQLDDVRTKLEEIKKPTETLSKRYGQGSKKLTVLLAMLLLELRKKKVKDNCSAMGKNSLFLPIQRKDKHADISNLIGLSIEHKILIISSRQS